MTRVEKYRHYRSQISNMKFKSFSNKQEAAEQTEISLSRGSGKRLGYDQVMEIGDIYQEQDISKKKNISHIRNDQIIYVVIAFIAIAIILLATIFAGIRLWR